MSMKIYGGTMIFKYETSDGCGWFKNFADAWKSEPIRENREKTIYLVSYWKEDNDGSWCLVDELALHKRPTLHKVKKFMKESMLPKAHCYCDFSKEN